MADPDILILPSEADGTVVHARAGQVSRIALTELATIGPGQAIIVLSGQAVRSYETVLPKASRRERLQAARFAHEDKIATDLDSLHLALSEGEPAILSLVDREWLVAVLGFLKECGIEPVKLIPDYAALSSLGDGPVHVIDRVVWPGATGHAEDLGWSDSPPRELTDSDLVAAVTADGADLLQGEFRRRTAHMPAGLGRIAALLVFCGLLGLAWQGVQARALSQQAAALRSQAAANYAQATGETAPSNLARAATSALRAPVEDRQAFLRLSNLLFAGLDGVDDIRVDRLSYNAARQELQLRLIYPDFDAAQRFEAAMRAQGGTFVTGGVREQSGEFVGEAVLRLGGAS